VTVALAVLAGMVAGFGLFMVITAGFALSFDSIRAVGRAVGVRGDWAWLLPAAIDGAMAVATVTAVVVRRLGRPTAYAWTVVLTNSGISIACNALHAWMGDSLNLPGAIAMGISAIPALNLALSVHLLVVLVDAFAAAVTTDRATPSGLTHMESAADAPLGLALQGEQPDVGIDSPDVSSAKRLQHRAWEWARDQQGGPPSGRLIGARFGRSARWGRAVKNSGLAGYL
jgi:hypothetical protein